MAIAGPAGNLIMAVFWGFLVKLISLFPSNGVPEFLLYMCQIGILINVY